MTALVYATSITLLLACGYSLFRRPFIGSPIFCALAVIAATMAASMLGYTKSVWTTETFDDALFLAAAWLPLWIVASALIYMSLYGSIGKISNSNGRIWVFCLMFSAIALFFAYRGSVSHPVTSLLDLSVIGWFLVIAGMGEGIAAENVNCADSTRRLMFAESASTAALGAILAVIASIAKTSTISLSTPVLSVGLVVAVFSMSGAIRGVRPKFPHLTIISLLWCVAYGLWLEHI